jgi:hypothetical protein
MISDALHSGSYGYAELEYENKWSRGDIIGYEVISFARTSVNTDPDHIVDRRLYNLYLNKNGIIYRIAAIIIDDVPNDFEKTWKHILKSIS